MSSANTPLTINYVTLNVHNLDRVAEFYQSALGLAVLDANASRARLGVGNRVLLELRAAPDLPRHERHEPGLFHIAFLLPTRQDLGRWLHHARSTGLALEGMADHRVSEAVYLSDPEGNGIEVYVDRPLSTWTYTADHSVVMVNAPLDVAGLLHDAARLPWTGAPDDTRVGHVHLQVGALEPAEVFYRDVLGLSLTNREYSGGRFFASGDYHHHIATNIWNSYGAVARAEPTGGLATIHMVARVPETLDAIQKRAVQHQIEMPSIDGGLTIQDPWKLGFLFELDQPPDRGTSATSSL